MSKEERLERIKRAQALHEQRKAAEAKKKELPTGVFLDKESGTYGFRISVIDASGKKKDTKRTGFSSAAAARKAREELRYEIKHSEPETEGTTAPDYSKTFTEVYEYYLGTKAKDKALGTLDKQESLWVHHIKPVFGDRKLADVTKGEMEDYLALLYREGDTITGYQRYRNKPVESYSYSYVEGFIKIFWLIYGIAYDQGWVDPLRYQQEFVNKSTKLSMPPKAQEEEPDDDDGSDDEIIIYSKAEIQKILEVVEGGNLQVPTEFALYCGLRRSEVFGLMKRDIDIENKSIRVRRQLLYDRKDRVFYIGPTKTPKSVRTVIMPDVLVEHLKDYLAKQEEAEKSLGYRNTEIVYNRFGKGPKGDNTPIQGGDFLFRKENGELMTVNSIKYWAGKCRDIGVDLKFHTLRHTNASFLASHGVPLKTLMRHLGHVRSQTALQYYVTTDEDALKILKENLNSMPEYAIK